MPDALADPLKERLHRTFPPEQAYTRDDWTEDVMPSPVRHYLEHLLRHQREREARQLRRARTDWVDYDHPAMEKAVRSFFKAMEDHTQVPQDEWADTLHVAIDRTTAHLVRPVPVLRSFVFDESDEALPLSEVQWRMRFFGPYGYLREAIQAFAKKHNRDALEPDAFERVLRRVDERMTADFDADRWVSLLNPLFETTERARGEPKVPAHLLCRFFEEKSAHPIAQILRSHARSDGVAPLSRPELHQLIQEATGREPARGRETVDDPAREPETTFEFVPDADARKSADTSATGASRSEPTPLWQQFQQGPPRPSTEQEASDEQGPQPLWTRFQTTDAPSTPESEPLEETASASSSSTDSLVPPTQSSEIGSLEKDVLGTRNPPNRDVYIEKLFEGDAAAYRRVLERLSDTGSWSTASQIIARDVFRAHQVNIYSDPAVHFTNTVEATFRD